MQMGGYFAHPGSERGSPSSPLLIPGPAASQCSTVCSVNSSSLLVCHSPAVPDGAHLRRVFFALDNVHIDFASASGGQDFLYQPNPRLAPLSREEPARPYRVKPGNVLDVEVSASAGRLCVGTTGRGRAPPPQLRPLLSVPGPGPQPGHQQGGSARAHW